MLKELERFKQTWQGEHPLHLLLAIGANELEDMLEGAEKVAEGLRPLAQQNVHMKHVKFADEEHVSVLSAILGRIPRFLWSDRR